MTESRMRKVDNLEDLLRSSLAESVQKQFKRSRPTSPMKKGRNYQNQGLPKSSSFSKLEKAQLLMPN